MSSRTGSSSVWRLRICGIYFHDLTIRNYKGYRESARLELHTGTNVVVGKNNAGKTALLDALSLNFAASPHRSILTKPKPSTILEPASAAEFTFTVTRDELIDLITTGRTEPVLRLPLPAINDPVSQQLGITEHNDDTARRFAEWFFAHDSFTFRLRREALGGVNEDGYWHVLEDSYVTPRFERALENDGTISHYCKFAVELRTRAFSFYGKDTSTGESGSRYYRDFILRVGRFLRGYVYRFKAERLPSGPCPLGTNRTLAPGASNLAEVLHLLHGNHKQFGEYIRLVREVMPEVKQVGTLKSENNMGEVVIWNDAEATSYDHLAFRLSESGTGVGHVLAILYVMLTVEEPQVIIIDEPQGFLHPGAARKLVEVLRRYSESKHQIVVATHSPTVITAANPSTITLVRQEGTESVFDTINVREVEQQRKYLSAIGARLSDVFGYDRVLWVEGQTEEICFSLIPRKLADQSLLGAAILRVEHASDFDRKDTKKIFAIYERLSQLEGGLVPPVVGFILDREGRSAKDIEDLTRQSRGRIRFIRRRMYENYLLRPEAIVAIVSGIEGFYEGGITPEQVRLSIEAKRGERKYFKPSSPPEGQDDMWVEKVRGALLLQDIFAELSAGRASYEKPTHSVLLTEWLIKNAPEDLREVSELLVEVLTGES